MSKRIYTPLYKLKKIGSNGVTTHNWDHYAYIRDLFMKDEIELFGSNFGVAIIEKRELNEGLKKERMWRTFKDCVSLHIVYKKNTIIVEVKSYNGDNMTGDRTSLNWTASFKLKSKHLKKLEKAIDSKIERMAIDSIKKKEDAAWKKKVEKEKEFLLK